MGTTHPGTGLAATSPARDTRVYLHAVIDNFSRRILDWRVEEGLNPLATLEILSAAGANNLSSAEPSPHEAGTQVVMDSGVENVNGTVDELVSSGQLRRVLAQVDVTFSNSLVPDLSSHRKSGSSGGKSSDRTKKPAAS